MVAYTCNPSKQEAGTPELRVPESLGYTPRSVLSNKKVNSKMGLERSVVI